jgi:tRNA 2-thiouridine synthesizing protein A
MAAIIIGDRMPPLLDARGLACPLPAVKARAALAALAPGETLVVLATDPEAPVDIGALAADGGHTFSAERDGAVWRIALVKEGSQPYPDA